MCETLQEKRNCGDDDTAAEDGCVGLSQIPMIEESLRPYGLRPIWIDVPTPASTGIGGAAKTAGVIEMPVGIAGINGILKLIFCLELPCFWSSMPREDALYANAGGRAPPT